MLNIGKKISELRKEKKWSQSDLAKTVKASRDISGKYERGENSPSIEMAIKLAEALDISVDYLLGKERFGKYDKEAIKRLEEIQKLDDSTRTKLFDIIDTYIRDSKARLAYRFLNGFIGILSIIPFVSVACQQGSLRFPPCFCVSLHTVIQSFIRATSICSLQSHLAALISLRAFGTFQLRLISSIPAYGR